MNKLLAAALLAFVPAAASGQEPAPAPAAPAAPLPDADPALWVVRDSDTTVYLFGTFHLLDGRRDWFNDEVRTAFDQSQELVLEAILPENLADAQPVILRYAVDPNGRTLSQRLSPEQNAALGRALSQLGLPAQALEPLEPWFASMTLAAVAGQRLGLNPEHGPETILSRAARQRSVPIDELEGLEHQMRMFDEMPEEAQIAQLVATIESIDKIDETLVPMLSAWNDGDIDRLAGIMNEGIADDPILRRVMLTRRNALWARWINQRMQRPGTVFIAVGAGHLGGPFSVQDLVRAYDLRSERVEGSGPSS